MLSLLMFLSYLYMQIFHTIKLNANSLPPPPPNKFLSVCWCFILFILERLKHDLINAIFSLLHASLKCILLKASGSICCRFSQHAYSNKHVRSTALIILHTAFRSQNLCRTAWLVYACLSLSQGKLLTIWDILFLSLQ